VPQDFTKALKWYQKAAEQGLAFAQYNLGVRYHQGQGGVPQDFTEAVKWYQKAAEQGLAFAQYSLGLMYANGQGVPRDYVDAHRWFNLSASGSQGRSHKNSVHNRDKIEKKITPAQLAEAKKRAREWKPKPHKSPMKSTIDRELKQEMESTIDGEWKQEQVNKDFMRLIKKESCVKKTVLSFDTCRTNQCLITLAGIFGDCVEFSKGSTSEFCKSYQIKYLNKFCKVLNIKDLKCMFFQLGPKNLCGVG